MYKCSMYMYVHVPVYYTTVCTVTALPVAVFAKCPYMEIHAVKYCIHTCTVVHGGVCVR